MAISDFLDASGKWVCTKCGNCCKMVGLAGYPELDRGDGICKNLAEDNTCRIYDDRPDYCRVSRKNTDLELATACNTVNIFILEREKHGDHAKLQTNA